MKLSSLPQSLAISMPVAAPCEEQERTANQNENGAPETYHVHGNGAVFAGCRIVVVTEQQDLVHGRADFVLGRLYQSQAHVARRVFHAVEIPGELAFGSEDHDRAGMRV